MKKIFIIFFTLSILLVVSTSCENDDPAASKGELVTASYNAATKTFTLKYESGYTNTVNAVIDNSVTPPGASTTLSDGTVVSVSAANTSGEATITTSTAV